MHRLTPRGGVLLEAGMTSRMLRVFFVLYVTVIALVAPPAEARGIRVQLLAPWNETPLLQEGCEWASRSHERAASSSSEYGFYDCLRGVWSIAEATNRTGGAQELTQKVQYDLLLDTMRAAGQPSNRVALLKMSLASRLSSPAVEAHWQLARRAIRRVGGCADVGRPFVLLSGRAFCEEAPLKGALLKISGTGHDSDTEEVEEETQSDELALVIPSFDHIYPHSGGRVVVFLYGIVGDSRTMRLWNLLEPYAESVRLIFRHLPVTGSRWENALAVQGYGVTVDVKSSEYKVVDEKSNAGYATRRGGVAAPDDDGEERQTISGFNATRLQERYPDLKVKLDDFFSVLEEAAEKVKVDLHNWEKESMGLAAVQYVMDATEGHLDALLDLLSRFPARATRISRASATILSRIGDETIAALNGIANAVGQGQLGMFLNGCRVSPEEMNLFHVLHKIEEYEQLLGGLSNVLTSHSPPSDRGEDATYERAEALRFGVDGLTKLLTEKASLFGSRGKGMPRIWLPKEDVFWLSNVETSPFLQRLPRSLQALAQMNAYGNIMLPRRNLFHVVVVVDLTTTAGQETLGLLVNHLQGRQPFRLGLVLADPKWAPTVGLANDGAGFAATPSASKAVMGTSAAIWEILRADPEDVQPIVQLLRGLMTRMLQSGAITDLDAHEVVQTVLSGEGKRTMGDIMADPDFVMYYQKTQEMVHTVGLDGSLTLVNGDIYPQGLMYALQRGIVSEIMYVRQLIVDGVLRDDDENLYDSIMDAAGAKRRYLASLYNESIYMDWGSKSVLSFLQNRWFFLPPQAADTLPLISAVLALHHPVTVQSLQAVVTASESLLSCSEGGKNCGRVRLAVLTCGGHMRTERPTLMRDLERLQWHIFEGDKLSNERRLGLLHEFVRAIVKHSDEQRHLNDPDVYEGILKHVQLPEDIRKLITSPLPESETREGSSSRLQASLAQGFCREMNRGADASSDAIRVHAGKVYYYFNGRRLEYKEQFTEKDFETAALQELEVAEKVWYLLEQIDIMKLNPRLDGSEVGNDFYASRVAAVASLLHRDAIHNDRSEEQKRGFPISPGPASFVAGPVAGREARHRLLVSLDPTSRESQQAAAICDYVSRAPIGATCIVYLNPSRKMQASVRNFHNFVSTTELSFDVSGDVVPPRALFHRLPANHLLTVGVVEPEQWTVFPMEAECDLDNIVLSKLPSETNYIGATYRIHSILLTGSAVELGTSSPLSGLPLQLRSSPHNTIRFRNNGSVESTEVTRDTLVMAIKAYFQLQAAPGLWYLTIQPGDIARAFYISHINKMLLRDSANRAKDNQHDYASGQNVPVMISSFTGAFISVGVSKVAGYEATHIRELIASSIESSRIQWPPSGPRNKRPDRPTLNIFSVASGHLYERFLRIMMKTVMDSSFDVHGANTTRIKFWLIENFLSPHFKEHVMLLAKHYGFEVGFVTYRWPWWLHKQTEKQRTIWAYKILFLDVLFPLEVDRIIFVDADQIVRGDLHELYNMDIGNAPMAYTPFCREYPNTATTNFRFWDRGFWMTHLRGKPYHISALYLVDVAQLRTALGGDKYRAIYSQLSQDPNSLANLDQDLPNFMQDDLPIYSLPEEWLWCETWCAQESKSRAKTIDLCNNPLTKTPKLDNVRRIIDGWDEMDSNLETLVQRLLKEKQEGESVQNNMT
ncbi:putative UDP glucose Glycoprotein Glucosyltransferase [Trypanosoma vivax]|uniref:Putative UDP-glucose:glycoprotein glucosyltransferase n=1 Tax=Trypanosoma vivax (strain Y486) TaxID=1055687 RepID=G0TTE1_TRYVY|nr:putative UDP-glucose:glycoprotein glucosyltransferase [Trypanosoma vivax]KAH8605634.1 putative UDP glucose Glycoprotein Glucosyltransferase [Trypanosoma vivax]CCC47222.1 putative UDP-glucose:glycoprotein glucosyltransferase [Trypanosoma vivax Y486]